MRLYENMVLDAIDMLKRGRFRSGSAYTPPDKRDQMMEWLGGICLSAPDRETPGDGWKRLFASVFSRDVEAALLIGSDIFRD